MKHLYLLIALLAGCVCAHAQIGYQISLLDNATGTPRANESVNVTIQITNSEGGTIYSQTSTETTNDFGVLSLTLGNAQTFANVDWTKLPFFVSATVNGVLIGRSQLLSVPVAECALSLRSCKDRLVGRTLRLNNDKWSISFSENTLTISDLGGDGYHGPYEYFVYGNCIGVRSNDYGGAILLYNSELDIVVGDEALW